MSMIHDVWWTAADDASRGEWVDAVSGLDGRISDDIISADPTRVRPKKKKKSIPQTSPSLCVRSNLWAHRIPIWTCPWARATAARWAFFSPACNVTEVHS